MPEQPTDEREDPQEHSWWPQENSHRLSLAVGDSKMMGDVYPGLSHHRVISIPSMLKFRELSLELTNEWEGGKGHKPLLPQDPPVYHLPDCGGNE